MKSDKKLYVIRENLREKIRGINILFKLQFYVMLFEYSKRFFCLNFLLTDWFDENWSIIS